MKKTRTDLPFFTNVYTTFVIGPFTLIITRKKKLAREPRNPYDIDLGKIGPRTRII